MKASLFSNTQGFYTNLFAIAVPIMLQNFITSLVNMLSTVMIGRLGTVEIAAVALGNQIFLLYNLTLFGICSAGSIFTAQFWGKRDIAGIRKNMGFCITLNLAVALFFTLGTSLIPNKLISIYSRDPLVIEAGAAYLRFLAPGFVPFALSMVFMLTLRSVEKVRLAITAAFIALSLNAVLIYLFIFGAGPVPSLGVKGAALATSIARYVEMLILIIGCYFFKFPPAGKLKELFAFNAVYAGRYFRIAIPVIINETLWSLGVSIQNLILARSSTEAIAAYNITNTVSQLTWVIFIGLGHGVGVLIGKKIGEGKEQEARDYAFRIVRFAPILSLGAIAILLSLSRLLPFVFNTGPEVMQTAALMFIVVSCTYPFRAFNISTVIGICRAGGDTVFCALYDLIPMWFLALPLGAAAGFIFHAPAPLILLCLCMEEPVKVILGIWRLKTGKWLRNVIN